MAVAQLTPVGPISRAGRFPPGGHPCTALTLPTPRGRGSSPSSPTAITTARLAIPGRITGPWLTASFGTGTLAPLARHPRTLRPREDGLRPLQPLAPGRHLAPILDALLL